MNVTIRTLPKNWKPEDAKAFNRWINKIHRHVRRKKI